MEAANIMLLHSAGTKPAADTSALQVPAHEREGGNPEPIRSFEDIYNQQKGEEVSPKTVGEKADESPAAAKPGSAEGIHSTKSIHKNKDGKAGIPADGEGSGSPILNGKTKRNLLPKISREDNLKVKSLKNKKNTSPDAPDSPAKQGPGEIALFGGDLPVQNPAEDLPALLSAVNGEPALSEAKGEGKNSVTLTFILPEDGSILDPAGKGVLNTSLHSPVSRGKEKAAMDKPKKFTLVDRRTGGGAKDDSKSGRSDSGQGLKLTGTGGKGAQSPGKLETEGFKLLQEEVLDSSEKIIKLNTELLQQNEVRAEGRGIREPAASQLTRHLVEQGNRQIVKQTGIILKNNNSGEIRLVLKPENLGSVRIQLNLQENSITGKILVDNSAVKYAFDQNMDDLYRAFKESGFETASLDVQVGGEDRGSKENGGKPANGPSLRKIGMIEEQIPLIRGADSADTLIDLVV